MLREEQELYHDEPSAQSTSHDGENHPETLKQNNSLTQNTSFVEATSVDKAVAWEAKRREIDQLTDALSLGIDEGIKETVVAFNMFGLNTSGSCEGHLEHGLITPYVDVEAPNKPETEYVGEMEVFQRVANKYGISFEEVRRALNFEAWQEAYKESVRNGQTPEFLQFLEETNQLKRRIEPLIEEFSARKEVSSNIRLHVDTVASFVRVWCGKAETHFSRFEDTLPKTVKSTLLTQRQAEMKEFSNFLRVKYFSESNNSVSKSASSHEIAK